jgi:hypothetical protein
LIELNNTTLELLIIGSQEEKHNLYSQVIFIRIIEQQESVIKRAPDSTDLGTRGYSSRRWRVHCELLWLWDEDSLGTPKGEPQPLEANTRGLVKGQQTKKTQCIYSELQAV